MKFICLLIAVSCLPTSTLGAELILRTGERLDASLIAIERQRLVFDTAVESGRAIPIEKIIRYGSRPLVAFTSGLLLVDGSRLSGRIRLQEDYVSYRGDHLHGRIPLSVVRALIYNGPRTRSLSESFWVRMSDATGNEDQIRTVTGDSLPGLLSQTDDGLILRGDSGEREIDTRKVRSIILSPILRPMLPETAMRIDLEDGCRLSPTLSERFGKMITLACGISLSLNEPGNSLETMIESIFIRHPRQVEFLANLEPLAFKQQTKNSSLTWDLGLNKDLLGDPIQISGRDYDRGLVMHADARVAYRLPAGSQTFQAVIGIMDSHSPVVPNHGEFRVLAVDDSKQVRELFKSQDFTSNSPLQWIKLDVQNSRVLILTFNSAGKPSIGNAGVWIDAFVSKDPQ